MLLLESNTVLIHSWLLRWVFEDLELVGHGRPNTGEREISGSALHPEPVQSEGINFHDDVELSARFRLLNPFSVGGAL